MMGSQFITNAEQPTPVSRLAALTNERWCC